MGDTYNAPVNAYGEVSSTSFNCRKNYFRYLGNALLFFHSHLQDTHTQREQVQKFPLQLPLHVGPCTQ
jgi:hypothetical protein